jgi:hypothetical protein
MTLPIEDGARRTDESGASNGDTELLVVEVDHGDGFRTRRKGE